MSQDTYASLMTLHCVKWKDMSADLQKMMQLKILEVLNDQPTLTTELLSAALDGGLPCVHDRLLN
jgi:hypothetical protein